MNQKVFLPTSYFGPSTYYKLINSGTAYIEVHETYQKRSIRNRCQILTANGPAILSVPLAKGKTRSHIMSTNIAYEFPWVDEHLKSIAAAYNSSPYIDYYLPSIEEILRTSPATLFVLNSTILDWIRHTFHLAEVSYTKEFHQSCPENSLDLRYKPALYPIGLESYDQVFKAKFGYVAGLSILDLIFNVGPETEIFLRNAVSHKQFRV